MDITALQSSPNADAAVAEIVRYGLERNVVELAAYGFTVIPPENTGVSAYFVERLRNAILRTHDERNDEPAQVRTMSLLEELGQVSHIFSDKTGTLTSDKLAPVAVVNSGAPLDGGPPAKTPPAEGAVSAHNLDL